LGIFSKMQSSFSLLMVEIKAEELLKGYVDSLSDDQIDTLSTFYILDFPIGEDNTKTGVLSFFQNIEGDEVLKSIEQSTYANKEEVIGFYNSSLHYLIENIKGVKDFQEYYSKYKMDKLGKKLYDGLLELLKKKIEGKLIEQYLDNRKDQITFLMQNIIADIGYDAFITPRYLIGSAQKFGGNESWKHRLERIWTCPGYIDALNSLKAEVYNGIDTIVKGKKNYYIIYLIGHYFKGACLNETYVWWEKNKLCLFEKKNDSVGPDSEKLIDFNKDKVKEYIIADGLRNISLDDIKYFKVDMPNSSKRKIILKTTSEDIYVDYDSLDVLEEIIPEKDYEVVDKIRKAETIKRATARKMKQKDAQEKKKSSKQNKSEGSSETKQSTEKSENSIPLDNDKVIEEIMKYKKLLDDGILTEEEFTAKKKQLLNI